MYILDGMLPFLRLAKVQLLCFWKFDFNDCEFVKILICSDKNTVLLSFVHPAFIRYITKIQLLHWHKYSFAGNYTPIFDKNTSFMIISNICNVTYYYCNTMNMFTLNALYFSVLLSMSFVLNNPKRIINPNFQNVEGRLDENYYRILKYNVLIFTCNSYLVEWCCLYAKL